MWTDENQGIYKTKYLEKIVQGTNLSMQPLDVHRLHLCSCIYCFNVKKRSYERKHPDSAF